MTLHTPRRTDVRSCLRLAVLAGSSLLGLSTHAALALAEEPAATSPGSASYNLTLKQLGRLDTINLQGTESSDGVSFGVRADQVVTHARLLLDYSYSPALLADLSQINVLVNDEVAASLALPKEGAGKPQQQTLLCVVVKAVCDFFCIHLQINKKRLLVPIFLEQHYFSFRGDYDERESNGLFTESSVYF